MKKKISILLASILTMSLVSCGTNTNGNDDNKEQEITNTVDKSEKDTTLIKTKYGQMQGMLLNEDKTIAWYGVPYAKAPVGELRFRAPQTCEAYEGIYDATQMKDDAIQINYEGKITGSEDCLNMNIYRPNTDKENLPILVFMHGGGNYSGTSSDLIGDTLAVNANAIVVSINYRLGLLGWINLQSLKNVTGEQSGNLALLDAAKALEWINENADVLGGDKNNITIAGQSAGGRDAMAAIISPVFDGLFDKAIIISGGMTTASPEDGEQYVHKALASTLVNKGFISQEEESDNWFANTSDDEIYNFLMSLTAEELTECVANPNIRMGSFPHLFTDGITLPVDGFDAISKGNYAKVPTMVMSCKSEFAMFALTDGYFRGAIFSGALAEDENLSEVAIAAKKYGSDLYASFNAERIAELLVEQEGQPNVYASRFSWGDNPEVAGDFYSKYIGATHGADMSFINGSGMFFLATTSPEEVYSEANKAGREALSLNIQKYIGNFMKNGDPNGDGLGLWGSWNNADNTDKIMILDANNDNDISHMSDEYIKTTDVYNAMKNECSSEVYDILQNNLLKGRFFDETVN